MSNNPEINQVMMDDTSRTIRTDKLMMQYSGKYGEEAYLLKIVVSISLMGDYQFDEDRTMINGIFDLPRIQKRIDELAHLRHQRSKKVDEIMANMEPDE